MLLVSFQSARAAFGTTPVNPLQAQSPAATPRVNVPNLTGVPFEPAIFWFGQVDPFSNYADVRLYYYEPHLEIVLHLIDRRLWYDTTPTAAELPDWDAVSLYLSLNGNTGTVPGPNALRFDLGLANDYLASYQGNGTSWSLTPISISGHTAWRGASGPNSNADSEGWMATLTVPFASLGLAGPPAADTQWGLAVILRDRDDAAGASRNETSWPNAMNPNVPATWGILSFGQPAPSHSPAIPSGLATIRQGLNGAVVRDAAVGGHTTCGNNGQDKWTSWGNANYAGHSQFNIQNQWDVSDWPCFSKYYVTFPLGSLPPGQTILSASLTLTLFGTAGGGPWGPPPNSYIHVLTVDQDWDEATLTWNNAPAALENVSGTWVYPVAGDYTWDVSRAVAQAYAASAPLRLALYSIDGERHSGKYFYTSDTTDWGGQVRPTLRVAYGQLCSAPGMTCLFSYLPLVKR